MFFSLPIPLFIAHFHFMTDFYSLSLLPLNFILLSPLHFLLSLSFTLTLDISSTAAFWALLYLDNNVFSPSSLAKFVLKASSSHENFHKKLHDFYYLSYCPSTVLCV